MSAKPLPDIAGIKATIESIGEDFTQPDDDWSAMLFIHRPDGTVTMVSLMLEPAQTAVAIASMMRKEHAEAVVFIHSMWQWRGNPEERPVDSAGRPIQVKDIPGRTEAVMIVVASKDGTKHIEQAEIHRHENAPPTLGPWDTLEDYEAMDGRMILAIEAGFE